MKCPENAIKVLELNFPWPKVRCMCVNGTFGEDCTERIASESQVTTIGIITLPEPVRLVEPNIKHDLRGKLPVGTTNVLVQVVVRARFAGNTKTNNCGLRLCVTGTGSRCVETYDTYPGAESTYLRNTAFPIVPVDTNNPTLIWDWEIFQFGCYDVNTTEVIVLSAFRGAGALPAHP